MAEHHTDQLMQTIRINRLKPKKGQFSHSFELKTGLEQSRPCEAAAASGLSVAIDRRVLNAPKLLS